MAATLAVHLEVCGGDIEGCCTEALRLARLLGIWVVFRFNDRQISVQECNTVEQLLHAYRSGNGSMVLSSPEQEAVWHVERPLVWPYTPRQRQGG